MAWPLNWLLVYSDLIAGILGVAGSVVLGWPFISETADRRHWERLAAFKRRRSSGSDPLGPAELEAYKNLRDQLIDDRLGQHQRYRRVTITGFGLLFLAFLFVTAASFERIIEKREAARAAARSIGPTHSSGVPSQ
jgi:hypothetical protein